MSPAPRSIFVGVEKVRPGCALLFSDHARGRRGTEVRYWDAGSVIADSRTAPLDGSDEDVADSVEKTLLDAVGPQLIADVPVGAFLSGGIDSSLIVALMQQQSARPVRTFTVGFSDPRFDEAPHARAIAAHLGTEHVETYLTEADLLDLAPRIPGLYDEPFADSSQIPTALVAAAARRSVTVSLSGDGGDELFGGYDRYQWWRKLARIPRPARMLAAAFLDVAPAPLSSFLFALASHRARRDPRADGDRAKKAAGLLRTGSVEQFHWAINSVFRGDGLGRRFPEGWQTPAVPAFHGTRAATAEELMMFIDLVTYLPDDLLVKVDRATMSVGLESRAPFLDHRVAELAWRLPLRHRIRDGKNKWVLRRILERHVPAKLFDRPKQGFSVPLEEWLRGPLRTWAGDLLFTGALSRERLAEPVIVQRVWNEHQQGTRNWSHLIWNLAVLSAWRTHVAR